MGSDILYFDSHRKDTVAELSNILSSYLSKLTNGQAGFVLLCIGTDRVTGDSLGPLIGYKLSQLDIPGLFVYGTLNQPVHALNLEQVLEEIREQHPDLPVLAVDASLGHQKHLGCCTLCKSSIRPGIGVKKDLKKVGDISITGIVCEATPYAQLQLQTTRLCTVMGLADYISEGILQAATTLP